MSYQAPSDLNTALALFASDGGSIVAGGTDLYPASSQGQRPKVLLDLTRIAELRGITRSSTGYRIGAATTWSDLVAAPLPAAFDGLKAAAREVGGLQIQNAGTLGGNICNASPAADGVPPLLTLDAEIEIASAARGTRVLPIGAFIIGVRETALMPDEIVTGIHVPPPPESARSAFEKLGSRRYLVISIAMTAVVLQLSKEGTIADLRIAVGACSAVATRLPALEAYAVGQHPSEISVTAEHLASLAPIDDVRGSAEYRLDVVREQCVRAIKAACR